MSKIYIYIYLIYISYKIIVRCMIMKDDILSYSYEYKKYINVFTK